MRRCQPSAFCVTLREAYPGGATHLFLQQALEFLPTVVDAFAVRRIHNPNQRVCLLKVVLPVRAERLLASYVPCRVSMLAPATRGDQVWSIQIFNLYLVLSAKLSTSGSLYTCPSYSIVLIMKPRVGLTLLTSSFMICFTIVVFPALSNPLCRQQDLSNTSPFGHIQHQYPHFLILESRFSQYRQHTW